MRRSLMVWVSLVAGCFGALLIAPPSAMATKALATGAVTATALPLTALHPPAAQAEPTRAPFDVLFVGGLVVDGTGNPWFRADVGVRDGRIAAIGNLTGAEATRTVDARGWMIAPGFIDIHSHADRRLEADAATTRAAHSLVAQGITTVVINQDGRSPWPIRDQVESLTRLGHGPNVIVLVGHGEVRRRAMDGDVERLATPAEIARMQALVREGMADGAWGVSAGLEYVPGRWSDTEEVVQVVAAAREGGGIFVSHQRSEGPDPMWYWPSQEPQAPPNLIDAVLETIEVAERTGVPSVASHIKAKGAHYWGTSTAIIRLIEEARARGVPIYADQYPYATTGTDGNTVLIPGWAFTEGARRFGSGDAADVIAAVLHDPIWGPALRQDVTHEIRRRGGAEQVIVLASPTAPELEGRSLQEVADGWGLSPLEATFRLQAEGDRRRRGGVHLRGFSLSELDIEAYAPQDWMLTASDGGIGLPEDGLVHARFYGTFPRKIAHYARDRGALTVPHAIRSATSLPAQVLGLKDRGQVREGFRADLVVFDLERLEDRATFFDPHQFPAGIRFVMTDGVFLVDEGERTDALPGRVLTPGVDGRP
jgi:N-acyl-D-amino-acid deacylase